MLIKILYKCIYNFFLLYYINYWFILKIMVDFFFIILGMLKECCIFGKIYLRFFLKVLLVDLLMFEEIKG